MGTFLRSAVLIITLIGGCEASAQTTDKFAIGHGVVCDTQKQIERYLALYKEHSRPEIAVQTVNAETEKPAACHISWIAFISGQIIGSVEVEGGVMRVTQIVVLVKKTERGWIREVSRPQYTAVFVPFDEA